MKYMITMIIIICVIFSAIGCSNQGDMANKVKNDNNVDKVINEQISKAKKENASSDLEENALSEQEGGLGGQEPNITKNEISSTVIEYDLTSMGSDLVYATVYHMMIEPDAYMGKTVRMEGLYYAVYYEPTDKYYHYCIIQDALACCAQGMEFILEDGNRIYPDEYPKENAKIIVQGIFETYREDGDDYLYCRLKYATMEVINE